MDIPRALNSAKEWDRGRGGALCTFFTERMVIDIKHRRKLIVEICVEIYWLKNVLKDENVTYSDVDMAGLRNLLEVAQVLEYQDII
jgi:hypothetical protein